MRALRTIALSGLGITAIVIGGVMHVSGGYEHAFQELYGSAATFFVSGPATGASPDVEGDAFVDTVRYPSGDEFYFFYKPLNVTDIEYTGDGTKWAVKGGSRTTVGLSGEWSYTGEGAERFAALMLEAFKSNNLNNYVDLGASTPKFAFTLAFDRVVTDNDPSPDDFGEILYFERGSGSGNSWLKFQAVDETGAPLGPWLVVSPDETVQTSPQTTVMRSDQKMGATSIDVSRLGVSEFQYLRISNEVEDEPAYTGGGDFAPDFKLMVFVTDPEQLSEEILGAFD